jgi:hypothetical protein
MNSIKNNSLIYYCLPTFINREYKPVALDHCIFWRPSISNKVTAYWYKNDNVENGNGAIASEGMRWGTFVEELHSCNIGHLRSAKKSIMDETLNALLGGFEYKEESPDKLYLLIIEL